MPYGITRFLQSLSKKPEVAIGEIDDESHAHVDSPAEMKQGDSLLNYDKPMAN
jgi:hypothetical protein